MTAAVNRGRVPHGVGRGFGRSGTRAMQALSHDVMAGPVFPVHDFPAVVAQAARAFPVVLRSSAVLKNLSLRLRIALPGVAQFEAIP